ncbi:unnamed protein product, partial [Amoebophrya sp. A25]|eukprot:GSA25T00008090001.1
MAPPEVGGDSKDKPQSYRKSKLQGRSSQSSESRAQMNAAASSAGEQQVPVKGEQGAHKPGATQPEIIGLPGEMMQPTDRTGHGVQFTPQHQQYRYEVEIDDTNDRNVANPHDPHQQQQELHHYPRPREPPTPSRSRLHRPPPALDALAREAAVDWSSAGADWIRKQKTALLFALLD